MILRVNMGDTQVPVRRVLSLESEDQHTIISANPESKSISIGTTIESYESWYNRFINNKREAIEIGGSSRDAQNDDDLSEDVLYDFTLGVTAYTKPAGAGYGYLRSISGVHAEDDGNVQLLPGLTIDIDTNDKKNTIIFSRIGLESKVAIADTLIELNRCAWYLYHALNSFVYRMNIWAPNMTSYPMFTDRHLLGVIPSYQAAVAAWNMKVWRKSFLWEISPVRETISFSIGYMALDCINPQVRCVVIIKNIEKYDDTTKFLTIYDQGISTNIESTINRTTTKFTEDGEVTVDGSGSDAAAKDGKDWTEIEININLGELKQGDYYKASFSLSVAQNETTTLYYQSVGTGKHKMTIEANWIVDGKEDNKYGFVRDLEVPALLLYKEEEEEEDNGDYIE